MVAFVVVAHTPLDVRYTPHEDVLGHVERSFGLELDRASVAYGIYGATEGFPTSRGTWIRIQRHPRRVPIGAAWTGAEAASLLQGIRKPRWFQAVSWADSDRDSVWRADEMEFIESPVIEPADGLTANPDLSDAWWSDVRASLATLGSYRTDRLGMTQQHFTKRIHQVFPNVDTTIDQWRTAHADTHWRNLTRDGHILDWEDWGAGPRGLDASALWLASLPIPSLAARVQQEFADDLQSRSGKLSQLLRCANVIRIAAQRDKPSPLLEPARQASQTLLADLKS